MKVFIIESGSTLKEAHTHVHKGLFSLYFEAVESFSFSHRMSHESLKLFDVINGAPCWPSARLLIRPKTRCGSFGGGNKKKKKNEINNSSQLSV